MFSSAVSHLSWVAKSNIPSCSKVIKKSKFWLMSVLRLNILRILFIGTIPLPLASRLEVFNWQRQLHFIFLYTAASNGSVGGQAKYYIRIPPKKITVGRLWSSLFYDIARAEPRRISEEFACIYDNDECFLCSVSWLCRSVAQVLMLLML